MQFGVCRHYFYTRVHTAAYYMVIHKNICFRLEQAVTLTEQHGSLGEPRTCSLLTAALGTAMKLIAE